MATYYVRHAPICSREFGKLVLKAGDDSGNEWVMEWSMALPWLREMQRLADEFDQQNRQCVVPARGWCVKDH